MGKKNRKEWEELKRNTLKRVFKERKTYWKESTETRTDKDITRPEDRKEEKKKK